MTPEELGAHLTAGIPGAVATISYGELTLQVPPGSWLAAAGFAATDPDSACDYFDWLGAVDEGDAITVVAHLYSQAFQHHVRLRTRVAPGEGIASLVPVFRGADWHEREAAEMFGVRIGDEVPAPLLLPPGFEGAPLRKDFVLASRVVTAWPGLVEPRDIDG